MNNNDQIEHTVLDKILRELDAKLRLYHISRTYDHKGRLRYVHQTWEVESLDEAIEIYLPIMARELFDDLCECNSFGLEVKYPGPDDFYQDYEDDDGRGWKQIVEEDYEEIVEATIEAARLLDQLAAI